MMKPDTYEKKALKALYELSRAAMTAANMEDVFENILDKAMKIIGVEKASIMRFDPEESTLRIIAARGIPRNIMDTVRVKSGKGISGKVFASGKPLLVTDVKKRAEALREKRYKSTSLISAPVTCFPLKVRGRAVGVINMTDKKNGAAFTPADLQLLTTMAAQAAAYIHIYDLVASLKETERMRKELELARDIQEALLPHGSPKLEGVEAAGACLMAARIGGDYYDFLSSGWAPPAFVVADVSGHDMGAALLMSAFRSALRAEAGIPVLPPSAVVRRMNRVMYHDLVKAEQFISMAYLQYIHSSRTLRYSSAGHHPVWLYSPKRKGFKELTTEGPLLGIERGEHFFEKKCTVEKGDVAFMYTDGIVEALGPGKQRFGMERLKRSIAKHAHFPPARIVDGVSKDVKKFIGGSAIKDDITLVALKFK